VEQKLQDIQDNLIAEEEILTSPRRIDEIATRDLGMTKLHPNQMILPPIETRDRDIPGSLAMAGSNAGNIKNSGRDKRFGALLTN
jgi:hypothetical protein